LRYKHGSLDKWDNYFPNKAHFIQDNYAVSSESENFHLALGYIYPGHGRNRGTRFGVNKKCFHVSHAGASIDSHYIGKTESS